MKYIVIELQKMDNGTVGNIVTAYDSQIEAESKYHQILAAAAISNLPTHSAIIINQCGDLIDSKCYEH